MIDILLLPFMCLSLAQESAKVNGNPFSVNEITSTVAMQGKNAIGNPTTTSSTTIYNEGSSKHDSYETAQEFMTIGTNHDTFELRGKTSKSNKKDVYMFRATDRTRAHFRFAAWGRNMTGEIHDERGNKLFEFTDDDEAYGPTGLFKKGAYFVVILTTDDWDTDYAVAIWSDPVKSSETFTIDQQIMSNYKAAVWESDFVPGGVDPIDGTVVKSIKKNALFSGVVTSGGFYSSKVDDECLYRSIYIWSKDVFDALREDIENYKKAAFAAVKKSDEIVTKLNIVSTAAGGFGLICSFFPAADVLGAALSVVGLKTSILSGSIGDGVKLNYTLIDKQFDRVLGALDNAVDGSIISIKESAVIRHYESKLAIPYDESYKLKFVPFVNQLSETYSVVERRIDQDYPTYDMKLYHGTKGQIISDCQGTFKTYNSIDDIKPLFEIED